MSGNLTTRRMGGGVAECLTCPKFSVDFTAGGARKAQKLAKTHVIETGHTVDVTRYAHTVHRPRPAVTKSAGQP